MFVVVDVVSLVGDVAVGAVVVVAEDLEFGRARGDDGWSGLTYIECMRESW